MHLLRGGHRYVPELEDYTTPIQKSPPWVQLIFLLSFNTALFVANALLMRPFRSGSNDEPGMPTIVQRGRSPRGGNDTPVPRLRASQQARTGR